MWLAARLLPTAAWVTGRARQRLWKLQEGGKEMRFVAHDRDTKFPTSYDVVFASEGIEAMLTPYRAPNAHAYVERRVRRVREEWLDHLLISNERRLDHVLREDGRYDNRARPHQGIGQQIPEIPTHQDKGQPSEGISWEASSTTTFAMQRKDS
jgi:putative transposase